MYFSKIALNPTRRGTRIFLRSPQAMHAVVEGSHPAQLPREEGRVLWRLDQDSTHNIHLYVVSPVLPDFEGLIEQAGWPSSPSWETTDYDRFLSRLTVGQQWRFRLTANPVRTDHGSAPRGSRGSVRPHVSREQQLQWFESRCERWGFMVPDNSLEAGQVMVSDRRTERFARRSDEGPEGRAGSVAISRARFTGRLQVTDAGALRSALVGGMGRAKAYGCGLMTLARVGS